MLAWFLCVNLNVSDRQPCVTIADHLSYEECSFALDVWITQVRAWRARSGITEPYLGLCLLPGDAPDVVVVAQRDAQW